MSVQIVEGKTIAASFVYPLGLITLALTPSELSAAPVDAVVTGPNGIAVAAISSSASPLNSVSLEPGTYDVWLGGDGWVAKHKGLTVVAGEARTVTIDPRLKTRRVQFIRDGAPLAKMGIEVADTPSELVGRCFKTDATGHVELRLGAGSYSFYLESMDVELLMLSASANWPLPTGVDQILFE